MFDDQHHVNPTNASYIQVTLVDWTDGGPPHVVGTRTRIQPTIALLKNPPTSQAAAPTSPFGDSKKALVGELVIRGRQLSLFGALACSVIAGKKLESFPANNREINAGPL